MPRNPNGSCSLCGQAIWVGKSSRPEPICRPCRRLRNEARYCAWCSGPVRPGKTYCSSACFGKADGARRRALRIPVTGHSRRVDRAANAAGMSDHARRQLLAQWRRQGRACTYCDGVAETVDHVIPLARGGTNYEGNLTPACRSCNSRKQDRLVIEFRLGRRASLTYTPFRERLRVERVAKVKPEKPTATCYICDATYTMTTKTRRTCGAQSCQAEHVRRLTRESYRVRAGLQPTWERASRPHKVA